MVSAFSADLLAFVAIVAVSAALVPFRLISAKQGDRVPSIPRANERWAYRPVGSSRTAPLAGSGSTAR